MKKPDYSRARQEAGFSWHIAGCQDAILQLSGFSQHVIAHDPTVCIEAYRKGRPLFREMWGDDVQMPAVSTPHISYGHINGLGAKLTFPEGGEVGHTPLYGSIKEGIAALKKPVDFAKAGLAPFYVDYWEKLKAAFPGEPVGFTFGLEGPVTTAWELRGHGFFTDIFDVPEQMDEFLRLVTDSIIEFHRFRCGLSDTPPVNPSGGGMCDDIASMIPPNRWEKLVLPFWEQYYRGVTTGDRHAHVEDLRPSQLPFLEGIGLFGYDPSISPKLNPRIISAACRVPFGWRLGSFHYPSLSAEEVADFVFQAVADGASSVFTIVAADMCNEETVSKVRAFVDACKEVRQMLDDGKNRENVGERVSVPGRTKFWSHWP